MYVVHTFPVRYEAKRRGLRYILDGHANMSVPCILYYEQTRQFRRLVAYRILQDPFYRLVMMLAVAAHSFVAFIEAPSPVLLITTGSKAKADARADAALAISGNCILLHV